MRTKSTIAIVLLLSLFSCKVPKLFCTKSEPGMHDMTGGKISSYKYYLPKKILVYSQTATVKAKYETDDDGNTQFVGNSSFIFNNDAALKQLEVGNEPYYVITENVTKSLDQLALDIKFYPSGVIKSVDAQSYNSGIEIAEGVFTAFTSLARTAFCTFPFFPKGAARDTTFKVVIQKCIDFEPEKYTDTVNLDEWIPKTVNNAFITISLKNPVSEHNIIDSVNNGFVYCDPKWLNTDVTFHNFSKKQANENQEFLLYEEYISYPQLGRLHVLALPKSTIGAGVTAEFNEDGTLTHINYYRNKDAATKLQNVNNMSTQVPALLKDIYSTQTGGSTTTTGSSSTSTSGTDNAKSKKQ